MNPPKVLMAHNYYQIRGGEEESFLSELSMLLDRGHEVITYTRDNTNLDASGVKNKFQLFSDMIWAKKSYVDVIKLIRKNQPQVAHFQNTFPLISPSVYYACQSENVPVVQSLRNYRLMCPNGLFLRAERICEDCKGRSFAWPGIMHACYRQSRVQTAAVAYMLFYHRMRNTWESQVNLFIALTEFSRAKFVQAGFPPEKIVVKPNYVPDPGAGKGGGEYVVFVGRLSKEKGIDVLLHAWKQLPQLPLKIVGDGPMLNEVKGYIEQNRINAVLLGRLSNDEAKEIIKKSAFLVFPSILYETFGRTIVEAFACSKPVIASRLGTSMEIISEGVNGYLFSPGNPTDLAEKVSNLWESLYLQLAMGENARKEYEEKYTLDKNYDLLMRIYSLALRNGTL